MHAHLAAVMPFFVGIWLGARRAKAVAPKQGIPGIKRRSPSAGRKTDWDAPIRPPRHGDIPTSMHQYDLHEHQPGEQSRARDDRRHL